MDSRTLICDRLFAPQVVSSVHAVVVTLGALGCFAEWPYEPRAEGFLGNATWSPRERFGRCEALQEESFRVSYIVSLSMVVFHDVLIQLFFSAAESWLHFSPNRRTIAGR